AGAFPHQLALAVSGQNRQTISQAKELAFSCFPLSCLSASVVKEVGLLFVRIPCGGARRRRLPANRSKKETTVLPPNRTCRQLFGLYPQPSSRYSVPIRNSAVP